LELVDGFKRLYAARQIPGIDSLLAHVISVQGYAQKALILQLNWQSSHIRPLEEANIIQSLHREDGLEQLAIAKLLGRHPSWVCRRLSLVEHLHEEVKRHIELGLIPASFGREMAKLPRGNQEEVLKCLVKHAFSRKETETLVRHLLKEPRYSWPKILYYPWELIHRVDRERPKEKSSPTAREDALKDKFEAMESLCLEVADRLLQEKRQDYIERLKTIIERLCDCVEGLAREKGMPCLPL
jgi:hypothetical protein